MSSAVSNLIGGVQSADLRQTYDPKDAVLFARLGYPNAEPLNNGMESAVYSLSDSHVGKVWRKRSQADVLLLQRFYRELADRDLPFATPLISEVIEVEGAVLSIERRLPGKPFGSDVRSGQLIGIDRLIHVMEVLQSVDVRCARELSVLDENDSPWLPEISFAEGLVDLLDRRVARFGDQLRLSVERFDDKLSVIKERVRRVEPFKPCLIHGDLGGDNLLVDETFNVVGVLDFGFLSTSGDPRFDASIVSGVFDMWSSRAQLRQHQFDALLDQHLGYERDLLKIYRSAYAIIVASAYDSRGQDGQFWWSATLLNRPDIHELLLS